MIDIKSLNFCYRENLIFNDLTSTLHCGRVYGVLGKNGVGKTTLLKLIAGLLKPSSGEITVMGDKAFERSPVLLENIFFLPEEFDFPSITAIDFIHIYGCFYSSFSEVQFMEYLKEFQVMPNIKLSKMSFGQKKKAYIAFALACNTKLLIMDEPTNSLDIPSKTVFRRIISSIATEERTIIISTHQVRDLDHIIDTIVVVDRDNIIINSPITDIAQRLSFVHLDTQQQALYSEQTIHGRWGIIKNSGSEETPIDMELLFNAVIDSPDKFKTILNYDK